MVSAVLIGLTTIFMLGHLYNFFAKKQQKKSYFQSSLFTKLFFSMVALTFGFALIYFLLSMDEPVLRINDETGEAAGQNFLEYLYFSGVTMLSVGYGDLVPVGAARFFSLIQAALGLLLPSAYFVKAFNERDDKEKEGQGNRSDKKSEEEEEEEEEETRKKDRTAQQTDKN
ncbi:potassium channel family protein [Planococcus salinus]|uniref:Two pore domain potassium channel family protein n=1 Tax=Planococcus salinus TaxID=1848460 RepID=A0A3M8P6R4_9BACL|nr:potassium channel family protein [Planococcus salinus]RNF39363.1 two pore domain potassium channel family protein [Planococcus salinus]